MVWYFRNGIWFYRYLCNVNNKYYYYYVDECIFFSGVGRDFWREKWIYDREIDSEVKGELLLNFFIVFFEIFWLWLSVIERGWVLEMYMSFGLFLILLIGKERFWKLY